MMFIMGLHGVCVGWMLGAFVFLSFRSWRARFVTFLVVLFGWWAAGGEFRSQVIRKSLFRLDLIGRLIT